MKRYISLAILLLLVESGFGQHRGDRLAFQGFLQTPQENGWALAAGNAFTAVNGRLASLFFNPAGLAEISRFQFAVSATRYQKLWRENQVYRPNRFQLTLPFYLEGLYTPDPANNGRWDYDLFNEQRDSTYIVREPVLGADPYSETAADWQRTKEVNGLNHVAAAMPLTVGDRALVVAAAYNRNDVLDFDRNDTYLDPHIGYDGYGPARRVSNDTLRMNWFRYLRRRNGDVKQFRLALAYRLRKNLNLGVRWSLLRGNSDDLQTLNKVGWFDLAKDNRFRFSYDTLNVTTQGTSKISAGKLSAGLVLTLNRIQIGLQMTLPYTLTRTWSYVSDSVAVSTSRSVAMSGEDRLEVPLAYAVGFAIYPHARLRLSLDLERIPYGSAKVRLAQPDSLFPGMADQNSFRMGLRYEPFDGVYLMAGYQDVSQSFVPDGMAFRDRGPSAMSYTLGLGGRLPLGEVVIAYEISRLKYYDSYYSNTNYALENIDRVIVQYNYHL